MGTPPASPGTFLPKATALLDFPQPPQSSVSLLPLSFSFSPPHLVSSALALQSLASPSPSASLYPKETSMLPKDRGLTLSLSERERETELTSGSSGSQTICLEVPP